MIAADLLRVGADSGDWPVLSSNPLIEPALFAESQILSARVDALTGVVGLLFDLRVALGSESNTGLLLAQGTQEFRWVGEPRDTRFTAWTVLGAQVQNEAEGVLRATFGCHPRGELAIRAAAISYFCINAETIGGIPPDYSGDEQEVLDALVGWRSQVHVVGASSL